MFTVVISENIFKASEQKFLCIITLVNFEDQILFKINKLDVVQQMHELVSARIRSTLDLHYSFK